MCTLQNWNWYHWKALEIPFSWPPPPPPPPPHSTPLTEIHVACLSTSQIVTSQALPVSVVMSGISSHPVQVSSVIQNNSSQPSVIQSTPLHTVQVQVRLGFVCMLLLLVVLLMFFNKLAKISVDAFTVIYVPTRIAICDLLLKLHTHFWRAREVWSSGVWSLIKTKNHLHMTMRVLNKKNCPVKNMAHITVIGFIMLITNKTN